MDKVSDILAFRYGVAPALCAACFELVEDGQAGWVVVASGDPENPVSVRVHDDLRCRRSAKNTPRNFEDIKAQRIAEARKAIQAELKAE